MRIAINSSTLNHFERSGLVVYLENLINHLAKIDSYNEYSLIFTSLRRKAHQMPGPQQKNFRREVLPIADAKFPFKNFIFNGIVLPVFFKKSQCDLYHAPWGFNLPNVKNVKKILTVHDLRTLKISDNKYPQDLKSFNKTLKLADVCITVSETTRKDILENFDVSPEKIKVVYNGVDERFMPVSDMKLLSAVRRKYNIQKKYFFSVGGVPRKNVERLITAFSLFKYKHDFLLIIGGEGSHGPWYQTHLNLINKLGLTDIVKLIGYIPDRDLPLLYNGSECFVFPSLYEGFGIPVLEAMKSGVPVIASNVSSLPEVGGSAAIYIDPYKEETIAEAMQRIVEDSQLKQELIIKGLARSKEFSWRKMAEETLGIYNECARM